MKWPRILLTGIGVCLAVVVFITLIVRVYAFKLAFDVRGAPDQARIAQFATHVGHYWSPVITVLLTLAAAFWVARKVPSSKALQGLLTGVVIAIIGLVLGMKITLPVVAEFVLTLGAGWVGGTIGSRKGK
jgi:hypothetical protein